jgi:hypothetical protein
MHSGYLKRVLNESLFIQAGRQDIARNGGAAITNPEVRVDGRLRNVQRRRNQSQVFARYFQARNVNKNRALRSFVHRFSINDFFNISRLYACPRYRPQGSASCGLWGTKAYGNLTLLFL